MSEWVYILTKKKEKIKIDKVDFRRASKHSWRVLRKKNSHRQTVVTSIMTINGPRQLTLGKFIMKPPKGKFVYPRRGGLDYRRSNLVICTMAERQQMLPKRRNQEASSKYKGVCWDNTRRKWRAEIYIAGECTSLGLYSNEIEAALAYNKRARAAFGKMAYQNQVLEPKGRRKVDYF